MNAIIKVTGEITSEMGIRICDEFLAAERNKTVDSIVFFISSEGGDTNVISTLWELVKLSQKSVCSIGTNYVASTASAIFMMPKRRILMPNTEFILHEVSQTLDGDFNVSALEEIVEDLRKHEKIVFEPLLTNSNLSESTLRKKIKGSDWILSDNEIRRLAITTESYNVEEVRKLLMEV